MPRPYSPKIMDKCKHEYLSGLTVSAIARMNGITRPQTLGGWVKRFGWDIEREKIRCEATNIASTELIGIKSKIYRDQLVAVDLLTSAIKEYLVRGADGKLSLPTREINRLAGSIEKLARVKSMAIEGSDLELPSSIDIQISGSTVPATQPESDVPAPSSDLPSGPRFDLFATGGPSRLSVLPGVPADGSLLLPPGAAGTDRDGVGPRSDHPGAPPGPMENDPDGDPGKMIA